MFHSKTQTNPTPLRPYRVGVDSSKIIMGSLCGKESSSSERVPGSTSASLTSLLPSFLSKKPKVGGTGRMLGGSSAGYHETGSTDGERSALVDARAAAALAAEVIPLLL